jgi:hypothetical protein
LYFVLYINAAVFCNNEGQRFWEKALRTLTGMVRSLEPQPKARTRIY